MKYVYYKKHSFCSLKSKNIRMIREAHACKRSNHFFSTKQKKKFGQQTVSAFSTTKKDTNKPFFGLTQSNPDLYKKALLLLVADQKASQHHK